MTGVENKCDEKGVSLLLLCVERCPDGMRHERGNEREKENNEPSPTVVVLTEQRHDRSSNTHTEGKEVPVNEVKIIRAVRDAAASG